MVEKRGKNLSQVKLDCVLVLTEEHLPRGAQEWEEVARLYNDGHRAEFKQVQQDATEQVHPNACVERAGKGARCCSGYPYKKN